jgi:hypothetical protein
VLEQEYAAISGKRPPAAPHLQWRPEHIRDAAALADRLRHGRDGVAVLLRETLASAAVSQLRHDGLAEQRRLLAALFNDLLDDKRLYDQQHRAAFDGIELRGTTLDAIDGGDVRLRNRSLLEDALPQLQRLHDIRLANVFDALHGERLSALCLSGGGIRSATIGLGVIEAMARQGVLQQFDYLSTVSGGGYIGGWLSAWIARRSLRDVIDSMRRRPDRPLEPEPAPVGHLRRFTGYLTPRMGLLSADTWTLGATYVRNLLLNWLAFLPPLAAVLSLPLLLLALIGWHPLGAWITVQYGVAIVFAVSSVVAATSAVRYVHANRPRQRGPTEGTGMWDPRRSQRQFLRQCLGPLVYAAVSASICWAWATAYATPISGLLFGGAAWKTLGAVGAATHLAGWMLAVRSIRRSGSVAAIRLAPGVGVLASGLVIGIVSGLLTRIAPPLWALSAVQRSSYVWLAVPALLALIVVTSHVYVGLTSAWQSDAEREWSARFTGWMLIAATAWFVGTGLVLMGPVLLDVVGRVTAGLRSVLLPVVVSTVAMLCGIAGVIVVHPGVTPRPKPRVATVFATRAGLTLAVVFFAWVTIALAMLDARVIHLAGTLASAVDDSSTAGVGAAIGVMALLLGTGLLLARAIDSNKFSLHAMYRVRLIAAYLGASREAGARAANRFTGFDDDDNLHLRDLWPQPPRKGGNRRPFHVFNATVNLVGGDNLAWQERKAALFTCSPLHCGSAALGYRPVQSDPRDPASAGYGGERGMSLGTAMAISGAAASPDMGHHSSPVLSLLLTFFNVRLGWWLGNPGHAGERVWQRSSPRSSLRPVIDEALGLTNEHNRYIHLTDGGHFDNLGLYAMVQRRCHRIVVVDASSDHAARFDDLAGTIRKIRIDLGVPIDVDLSAIQAGESSCAVGTIDYARIDGGGRRGTLIYFKPALTAGDPVDVVAYAGSHPHFPHDSTVGQWFSESQFESYREIGVRMGETAAAKIRRDAPPD